VVASQAVRAASPSSVKTWSELERKAMSWKGARPASVKSVSSLETVALKAPDSVPRRMMASLAVGIDSW